MLCLCALAAPADAGLRSAAQRQWSEVRQNFGTRPRVARMAVSAGLGAAVGFAAQHHGAGYPVAVYVSYATSEVVDRALQRRFPATRSVTPDSRGPWGFAAETLLVSSVAAGSAAVLQHQMEPFTHTLLGRATPGVIGISAGALYPRALVRGALSVGVTVLTNGTKAAIGAGRSVGRRVRASLRRGS